MMVATTTAACAPVPSAEVAGVRMTNGAAINTVAAPHGRSVVLVISPADCISCDIDLARWLGPGRDTTTTVAVILTREPSDDERRLLTMLRLPVAGQVDRGTTARRISAPCILHFDDGRPISSACSPS